MSSTGAMRRSAAAKKRMAASEDLADAEFVFEHDMPKRTTITAYYAMFHAARALVMARGYVEKSHYCLLVGFRAFYGQEGEGRELARGIERARVLRENADYHAEFSQESAQAALDVARRFPFRRRDPAPGAASGLTFGWAPSVASSMRELGSAPALPG